METLKSVVIFGLRCSGTNYIAELIKTNYPDIQVEQGTCGLWKHLWQVEETVTADKLAELSREPNLYIYVCRNVFDWLLSFNKQSHHCLWANDLTLDELLTYTPFESRDDEGNILESYNSIIQERNTKHQHVVDRFAPALRNFILIKYEDICDNPDLIKDALCPFGFLRKEPIENVKYYKQEVNQVYVPKQYPKISPESMRYIIDNVDWVTESKLGYEKPTLLGVSQ